MQQKSDSSTTLDVVEWMRTSGPRSLAEVEQLRKGMRKKAVICSLFERHIYIAQSTGRELWYIKGHASTLVLASKKHRKLFRAKLNQRFKHLEDTEAIRESDRLNRERELRLKAEFLADIVGTSP